MVQGLCVCAGAMLNHGLDESLITIADNEVVVVLRGQGEDMNRIRIPENITAGFSPSVAAKLNERQKAVLAEIVKNGTVFPPDGSRKPLVL